MNKKQNGAVVIIALLMISVLVMITQQLMQSVYVGSRFTKTMMDRERAKTIALSGIQEAIAQLLPEPASTDDQKNKQPTQQSPNQQIDSAEEHKQLLKILVPNLNRWQEFTFKEKTEGIDATLKICITCEQGKININEAFDFQKQEFKKPYDNLLSSLEIPNKLAAGDMLKALQEFLTQRKKKLDDISQLSEIKALKDLEIFYKPPLVPTDKKEKAQANKNLTLQDIFTVWTPKPEMHPLLFSDALCALLSLRRPMASDAKNMQGKYEQFFKVYRDDWAANWSENWKNLNPLYNTEKPISKDLEPILAKQFEPSIYSVLSYAKVGNAEQQLLVIIKKKTKKMTTGAQSQQKRESFNIVRVYWL